MIEFEKTVLPNGVKIVSEKMPYLNSVALGFWFNIGSRDENADNNGVCHFIEHMLFKGTEKRTAKQISDEIEGYGGYLNAFTSKEHTCYYARVLDSQVERSFDVLADMILEPKFASTEIKKESKVIVDEFWDVEDNPEEFIFDKFEELIFKNNKLAYTVLGSEKNIKLLDREKIFNFYSENYAFNNLTIALSGNYDHNKLVKLAEKYFSGRKETKIEKRESTNTDIVFNEELQKDFQQVHVLLGVPTYGFNELSRTAVNVLSCILGDGSSSRLFQKIREKNGITYQIGTYLNSYYDISTFCVYFSTNRKSYQKAMDLVLKEFDSVLTKGFNKNELLRAKEYLKGNMILSLENPNHRMFRLAQNEIYYNEQKTIEESLKEIDNVGIEKISELAKNLLNKDKISTLILQSEE